MITEGGIDGYANVVRTASADLRIGAIVQTCHGQHILNSHLKKGVSRLECKKWCL